jgi:NADP-dependent 3-hydroxy acid dehydrogenase YdfG
MTPQTILITGATSGIGRHAALALATRGHRVFATGRRVEQLRALEVESGGRIEGLRVDVTDSASIDDLRAEVLRRTDGSGVDGADQ